MFDSLHLLHRGKVRDIWAVGDDNLIIHTSDRISVFDDVLPTLIPGRGEILTNMTRFWAYETKHIIPNHITRCKIGLDIALPNHDERPNACKACQVVKRYQPLLVECIVSGFLVGSIWRSYQTTGGIFGDFDVSSGVKYAGRLSVPVFWASTKAPAGQHDVPMCFEELESVVGSDIAKKLRAKSLELFHYASRHCLDRNIFLVDTKFEFAIDTNGELVLIDEIITPDSSRFWDVLEYYDHDRWVQHYPNTSGSLETQPKPPSFDKEIVRDYVRSVWDFESPPPNLPENLTTSIFRRYAQIYQRITN
jgi:phosphoribosylaminoimidazole-succinocarboxamide synthase